MNLRWNLIIMGSFIDKLFDDFFVDCPTVPQIGDELVIDGEKLTVIRRCIHFDEKKVVVLCN